MQIINIETKQLKTLHYGTPPAGCIPVPPRLEKRAAAYAPNCDLVIEDGVLVDILPLPRPEPEQRAPTDLERAQQDITDLQLADIERGQEITDIQIAMLEVQK